MRLRESSEKKVVNMSIPGDYASISSHEWPIKNTRLTRSHLFELCRRTQQPSLTFRLVGGSMFGLWPLFHLRDGGKWTEMTATQHGGTLRHDFLHYFTIKIMLSFFHYLDFFKNNCCSFYLSNLVSPNTGCKSQLF
jgi:hypothetical protein